MNFHVLLADMNNPNYMHSNTVVSVVQPDENIWDEQDLFDEEIED